MRQARLSLLLCASFVLPAAAEEAFVTELRLPARDAAVSVFAWRGAEGVLVERSALEALGVSAPGLGERVALRAIPGLAYVEHEAEAAITMTCAPSCFSVQRVGAASAPLRSAAAFGFYLNYDLALETQDEATALGGVGEATAFGRFGLLETSWFGRAADGLTRLETRWTYDMPDRRVRVRVGDAAALGAGGRVARFAGVQIERRFALEPSFITYPTPALAGEADAASTVELYIDGALRAREQIEAGPFALDSAPFITGAGEAELVVTDILGRQQTLSRPFFVSSALLRAGLSDWSVALGAERVQYGRESGAYGGSLFAARYRRGLTNALTAEAALDAGEDGGAGELAATFAHWRIGQVRVARAQSGDGGASSIAFFHDARVWSAGLHMEQRDAGFLERGSFSRVRRTGAASFNVDLGALGSAGVTAAGADFADAPSAHTLTLAYAPDWTRARALSFRIGYAERERAELSVGMSLSMPLAGGLSSSFAVDVDERGGAYRAAAQSAAPASGGLGWRARAAGGVQSRLEFAAAYRGRYGESGLRIGRAGDANAARLEQTGAVGWVDGAVFAGAPIRGAFALVDAGAPGVGVLRDRLRVGGSGDDGRMLVTNLRANETNLITLAEDDLPMQQVLAVAEARVAPPEGMGVLVRFDRAVQHLSEARVRLAHGAPAPRGAVLVRVRDGARFPVGREGRAVLMDAAPDDVFSLDGQGACRAETEMGSLLMFICVAP